jgi:hypothetical protein
MPVILASQEAEIRRILVQSLSKEFERPYLEKKKILHKKRAGGVAQDVDPEFKPQYPLPPKKLGGWAPVVHT